MRHNGATYNPKPLRPLAYHNIKDISFTSPPFLRGFCQQFQGGCGGGHAGSHCGATERNPAISKGMRWCHTPVARLLASLGCCSQSTQPLIGEEGTETASKCVGRTEIRWVLRPHFDPSSSHLPSRASRIKGIQKKGS